MADLVERYLELGLRLGRHAEDLVDSYYGPAELGSRVESEDAREPAALVEDAAELAAELERDPWLAAQVRALEANARKLAGEPLDYAEEGRLVYGIEPRWHDEEPFRQAAVLLDEALPGAGDVRERYARWFEKTAIPAELVEQAVGDAAAELRRLTREQVGLPQGEEFGLEVVTGERWLGYARYRGGLRTEIMVNVDLPFPPPTSSCSPRMRSMAAITRIGSGRRSSLSAGRGRSSGRSICSGRRRRSSRRESR